jgi:perosamine synthetase
MACWSFHAVKNLAAGDGGMVTTSDDELDAKLRRLRWCGIDRSTWDRQEKRYGWEYDIREPGYKAHMNDLTAALGMAQLSRLGALNASRRLLVRRYRDELKDLDWMRLPTYREGSAWHLFAVRVPETSRDPFIGHMLDAGVSAGLHYKPLNTYPVFGRHQPLPVTDRVWKTLVTLPLFPDMTDAEFGQIVAAARSFSL